MATLPSHSALIGNHPTSNPLVGWLDYQDTATTPRKKHRALKSKANIDRKQVVEWIAKRLIEHHYSDTDIASLKKNYKTLGFKNFAEANRRLPRVDRVMKGNLAEILLIEYVQACQTNPLVKAYKLRYNPNVDQAMKGDDLLMFDLTRVKSRKELVCFLGESKFRKRAEEEVIQEISASLSKKKKPLSYSFVVSMLRRDNDLKKYANLLDQVILKQIKAKSEIIYTGFLLAGATTARQVEKHLDSSNSRMVFISLGLNDPEKLVLEAFKKAETLIATKKI